MYLLFPSIKSCLVPASARLLGLSAFLLVFAQCQPEPVGKPPSSPKSPPPFEQVWRNYLGDKLRPQEFNKRLITTDEELLLTTYEFNISDPQRLVTISLDSGNITAERTDIFNPLHFFLGGNGPDYYFTDQNDQLKRFNAQTQVMQQIGTYRQPEVYLGADPIPHHTILKANIFRGNEEMISVNEVSHFQEGIDYVYVRYDLASGQLLDTHHIPMPGDRIGEPDWSFTPVWTGPKGQPYTVAYRYNKAIWIHAETFQGIDTLQNVGSWFQGNFAKNTVYYEDRQTGRLTALRMPGRELLWEGPTMSSEPYGIGRAGEKLLVCEGRINVYHRRTGDYLWSTFPALMAYSCGRTVAADGLLLTRSYDPLPDQSGQVILIRNASTGRVEQTLEDIGQVKSFRYHQPSGTLLVFSTKTISAYRRPK